MNAVRWRVGVMKASLVSIFAQDWHPQKFDRPDRSVIADILGAHGLGGPSFTQGWTWVLERHQLLWCKRSVVPQLDQLQLPSGAVITTGHGPNGR